MERRLSKGTYLPNELLLSKAYQSLKYPASYRVYAIFRLKLVFPRRDKKRRLRTGREDIGPLNGKELQFTYREAKNYYGLTAGVFLRALRDLHRVGLIDVIHTGMGLKNLCNVYGMSNRWRFFGLNAFEFVEWPIGDTVRHRFSKGNRSGARKINKCAGNGTL